ncbi:MAG: hypothetical protein JJE51_09170 [Thermoanaerobaculia bacterium]|nr:hypothetical protein [Thermoanaerobaculia bacterium]
MYGLVGVQTHAKLALVVRAEGDGLRHYIHLSTGNYNVESARSYTDLDLLTANEAFGREASQLMNILTGYSSRTLTDAFEQQSRPQWQHFVLAPFDYHRWLISRIEQESRNATDGKPARVVAKLNSLVDSQVIQALYAASGAGVKVDLIVRSMCSLVPGVKKVSENIRVMSVVDRFLEHSRILRFENGGTPEVFLSSGDWMPRNFQNRIEITFPLVDRSTRETAISILDLTLGDTASSWDLQPDGVWKRRGTSSGLSSQKSFIDIARAESFALEPYRDAVAHAGKSRKRGKKTKK